MKQDGHTFTGEYQYPHGPKHYGLGLYRCDATGLLTTSVREWRWCEHCASPERLATWKSLHQLNEERRVKAGKPA